MPDGGVSPDINQGQDKLITPEMRTKMITKAAGLLAAAGYLLSACGGSPDANAGRNIAEAAMKDAPSGEVMENNDLHTMTIKPGDSVVSAIDRFHGNDGAYNTYGDMGLVVMRNGEPEVYFKNKLGIDLSGLAGGLVRLHPGDEIEWGKVDEVREMMKNSYEDNNALTLTGERGDKQADGYILRLVASGGELETPIIYLNKTGEENGWESITVKE